MNGICTYCCNWPEVAITLLVCLTVFLVCRVVVRHLFKYKTEALLQAERMKSDEYLRQVMDKQRQREWEKADRQGGDAKPTRNDEKGDLAREIKRYEQELLAFLKEASVDDKDKVRNAEYCDRYIKELERRIDELKTKTNATADE